MRYIFKLIPAFLNRFRYLILVSVILGLVSFFVFEKIIPTISSYKTTKIGITGRFTPDELPDNITKIISRGLTQVMPDGTIASDLATWESSDQGSVWTFKLKDGFMWQDGKSLVSTDVNYEFSDVETQVESGSTIVFKLKDPFIPFPSVLAKPIFKKGLLGLGDWKVKKVRLNGRYVQELNLENKSGERMLYKFYPTEEATKTAFKLGKVIKIENISDPSPFNEWNTARTDKINKY
jgi:ABC-type transport system substrate-binding protein